MDLTHWFLKSTAIKFKNAYSKSDSHKNEMKTWNKCRECDCWSFSSGISEIIYKHANIRKIKIKANVSTHLQTKEGRQTKKINLNKGNRKTELTKTLTTLSLLNALIKNLNTTISTSCDMKKKLTERQRFWQDIKLVKWNELIYH